MTQKRTGRGACPYPVIAKREEGQTDSDILLFFDKKPAALPLYEAFEQAVLSQIEDVHIRAQKTQISFSNRHLFAAVSFLPVVKAKERPEPYITISFGLDFHLLSPRIQAATEPYPNRWTHHVLIDSVQQIDAELMDWIKMAAAFSAGKRGSTKGGETD